MFGHSDNQDNQSNQTLSHGAPVVNAPDDIATEPVPDASLESDANELTSAKVDNSVVSPSLSNTPPPSPSAANSDDNLPQDKELVTGGPDDDLLAIKQQALQQLTPLVDHLDQTPQERFKTTMMMIQASDNQDLIPSAYESAQQITDEKAKAQALLDIINEINYFSQHLPSDNNN